MTENMLTHRLAKGSHTFIFRYAPGDEAQVLDALIALVKRPDVQFDWFDAALVSHEIGVSLSKELKGAK